MAFLHATIDTAPGTKPILGRVHSQAAKIPETAPLVLMLGAIQTGFCLFRSRTMAQAVPSLKPEGAHNAMVAQIFIQASVAASVELLQFSLR